MSRSRKPLLIGLACSIGFLYLALRQVKLADVAAAFGKVTPASLAALVTLAGLDLLVRGLRWKLLLPRSPQATALRLFKLEAIGLAINNVVPFRLGEFARAYLASRQLGLPLVTAFASIVVERVFDFLALLAMLLFVGDWGGTVPAARGWAQAAFAALLALAAAFVWLEKGGRFTFKRYPGLSKLIEQTALGARALAHVPSAAGVVALSGTLWGLGGCQYLAVGLGLGIKVMTYPVAVLAMCAAAASTALPAVPGYFGTYEFAVKSVLVRAGAPEGASVGFASLLHLFQFGISTGLGLFFLYREGHTLSSIREAAK